MGKVTINNPDNYWNRELSWVQFDRRVLSEAKDKNIPLFERIKFLAITASNLDEFFMIRVASLKDMDNAGYHKPDISGMTPKQQLKALNVATHNLVDEQYKTYNELKSELAKSGIKIISDYDNLTKKQCEFVDNFFFDYVYPVLTPMAVDSSRPFPLIRNKSLNIGALVKRKGTEDGEYEFATVQVPSVIPRILEIPDNDENTRSIVLLEKIIEKNIEKLFLNYDII